MSLSPAYSAVNLYCSEVADEVVDLSDRIPFPNLDSSTDDESFILGLFDSELDQMLCSERLPVLPEGVRARQDAVNWMLKVHSHYNFRPETAYLSVTYLDRFLCTYDLPVIHFIFLRGKMIYLPLFWVPGYVQCLFWLIVIVSVQQGKEWSLQLLSVACIAVAAKMEERSVPLLLDLQVMEPRFLFTAMTVQQMELLVMAVLKWRLSTVTPFSFVNYFISKFPCFSSQFHSSSNVSDLILASCRGTSSVNYLVNTPSVSLPHTKVGTVPSVTDHLDFLPSSIAAASLLWVAGKNVDDQILEHFHKRVNKEMVKRCHYLIKQSMCSMVRVKRQRLEPGPPSPDGVLDADISKNCDVLKCGGEDSKSSQD
ncbi:Cyclin-D4-1 [Vitis vinifera]|uniref:Cyclin-D4-1 n=1 Tax=Vitis vinifera TaxID=29760 RepID=A0A438FBN8_VITVI|nr:Cyclin-D4-1 [Vitis vinifera]RVX23093.1 Cyclin-D4-1 [Vitis vinifera]